MAIMFKLIVLFLLLLSVANAWWPFSSDDDSPASDSADAHTPNGVVQFEMKTAEQKFLEESRQLLNLSPLDQCHYSVVSSLKRSCGEMMEEDLSKMSVQLLNCQAQAEGRPTFPCTADMSVAECTGSMDAHMWNAYHIISNRARSVCYATRQQQFRKQTETAVNHLSRAAVNQIKAMEELADSQHKVQQIAQSSLTTIKKEHDEMLERQSLLVETQHKLKEHLNENLEKLTEEKSMIHRGQKALVNMTSEIHHQIGVASAQLQEQEERRRKSQLELMGDISALKGNVKDVWKRIDNSTAELLVLLDKMNSQYEATLQNLNTINKTVSHVLGLLDTMNSAIGIQLQWVMQQLGGAQDGLGVLLFLVSHCFFLLLSSLVLVFVRAPWLTRLALLLMVVCNVAAEIKLSSSLTLSQLTVLVLLALFSNWFMLWYRERHCSPALTLSRPPRYSLAPPTTPQSGASSETLKTSTALTEEISDTELEDLQADTSLHSLSYNTGHHTGFSTSYSTGYERRHKTEMPAPDNVGGRSFLSTPKCAAVTRNGLSCRLSAMKGDHYCFRHKK